MDMLAGVFEDAFGRWHPEACFETRVYDARAATSAGRSTSYCMAYLKEYVYHVSDMLTAVFRAKVYAVYTRPAVPSTRSTS